MDLLQLHYFRTVARHQHVTRAAEELIVAQPSLSKTIARLETELGAPLFDRRGRRVVLNQFGQAFLVRVERVFAELDEGRREIADMAGVDHGTVAVASTTLRTLPDLLRAFRARHPHVNFRLSQASTAEMGARLAGGDVDFCFASAPIAGPAISSIPLFTEEILLAVPPEHPYAGREEVALSELAGEAFVGAKPGYWLRDLTDMACRQAGFVPLVVCEGDEPGALYGLVAAGLGVAFLPASSRRESTGPAVSWLRLTPSSCERTVALVWRNDRYLSAAAQQFCTFAVAYYTQQKGDADNNDL